MEDGLNFSGLLRISELYFFERKKRLRVFLSVKIVLCKRYQNSLNNMFIFILAGKILDLRTLQLVPSSFIPYILFYNKLRYFLKEHSYFYTSAFPQNFTSEFSYHVIAICMNVEYLENKKAPSEKIETQCACWFNSTHPSAIDSESIQPLSVLHSGIKFEW